jgi:hypothetical protein
LEGIRICEGPKGYQDDRKEETNDETDEEDKESQSGWKKMTMNNVMTGMRLTNNTKLSPFNGDPGDYQRFKETFRTIFPDKVAPDSMLITQLREYLSPK